MSKYFALIHKDVTSDYGVSFPDFPGCTSAGETYEKVLHNAIEALAGHVALMRRDGDPIPAPRDLDTLRREEGWIDWQNATVTMIPLLPAAAPSVRLNISLDSGLLEEIDRAANAAGMSRSAYLARAAKIALSSAA
jgi:predicted RNase H-like HicB family nuclease